MRLHHGHQACIVRLLTSHRVLPDNITPMFSNIRWFRKTGKQCLNPIKVAVGVRDTQPQAVGFPGARRHNPVLDEHLSADIRLLGGFRDGIERLDYLRIPWIREIEESKDNVCVD